MAMQTFSYKQSHLYQQAEVETLMKDIKDL